MEEGRPDGAEGRRHGQRCPECGTSREPGSAPACGCTERAADAARDARSADAAAAEDFDPLRIRPYVTLPEPGSGEAEAEAESEVAGLEPGRSPVPVLPPEAVAPPRSTDVGLFAAGEGAEGASRLPSPSASPSMPYDGAVGDGAEPRRGRTGLYAGVSAVVAVVGVAVLATVLLSPDKPQREQAMPDVPTRAASAAPSGSASEPPSTAAPSSSAAPSAPASTSKSASPRGSSSPSPSSTASAKPRSTPPPSRSTARATGSVESGTPKADGVLKRGDRGPEVEELQGRLRQLYLYMGEADGTYDTSVAEAVTRFQYARATQADGEGVYGERTRAALERETREP
ncbi:peptidoglycan-binding domain-containing protein [Streptomyces sp. Je 1-332]|uniref:peptidoglycan-binding domain-containing protein n=1 Tax=Streptomyces sp. Je 1-332 TaxID=3231270 RepID=UPI003459B1F5